MCIRERAADAVLTTLFLPIRLFLPLPHSQTGYEIPTGFIDKCVVAQPTTTVGYKLVNPTSPIVDTVVQLTSDCGGACFRVSQLAYQTVPTTSVVVSYCVHEREP